jgi:Tfp pilus assembly protein PilF
MTSHEIAGKGDKNIAEMALIQSKKRNASLQIEIYLKQADWYKAQGKFAEAEKYFSKATTLATRWALPWANLSYLYAVTGRSETGFNACYKADSLQPGLPCVSNNFGWALSISSIKTIELGFASNCFSKASLSLVNFIPKYSNTFEEPLMDDTP